MSRIWMPERKLHAPIGFGGGVAPSGGLPSVFSASSVPNTQLWAMAESGYVATDGGGVYDFQDRSSHARHFAQSNSTYKPAAFTSSDAAFSNRGTITFNRNDGITGDHMDTPSWSAAPTGSFAIAMVLSATDPAAVFGSAACDGSADAGYRYQIITLATSGYWRLYGSGGSAPAATVSAGTSPNVILAQFTNSTATLYVNNITTPVISAATGPQSGSGYAMRIGQISGAGGSGWGGKMAFVGAWLGDLSLATRAHIMRDHATSLGPYYGITVT